MSLQGRTVALAEGRQLEELAQLLLAEGASVLRCPMIGILDAPDPAPVAAWLGELSAGRFDYVILLTGEGLRRLLALAERQGTRESTVAALAKTRLVVRGPKPVRALREIGLTPGIVAAAPTTEGVIASLCDEPLHGVRVGVQLYSESNPPLVKFLEAAGATVSTVQPYVYAPAADAERVAELIERLQPGTVDALVFTSSPQVDRLFQVAEERHVEAKLRDGLARTCVAVVGPVVAENFQERGIKVDVMPAQGFVMKNLVQHLKRRFAET
jgi:uroporphyrinogen-III synthase